MQIHLWVYQDNSAQKTFHKARTIWKAITKNRKSFHCLRHTVEYRQFLRLVRQSWHIWKDPSAWLRKMFAYAISAALAPRFEATSQLIEHALWSSEGEGQREGGKSQWVGYGVRYGVMFKRKGWKVNETRMKIKKWREKQKHWRKWVRAIRS